MPDLSPESMIEMEILKGIIYGLGKAEAKIVGKAYVFSKLAFEVAGKWWLEKMGVHGLDRIKTENPLEALEDYIKLMEEGKFFVKGDISAKKLDEGLIQITGGLKCPFREACERLAKEGIPEHGCPMVGPLIVILKEMGYSVGYSIKTEESKPCIISIEYLK
ncbi:MAG: hypothetical protein ACP6IQ_10720 [Candidatus Njordarchaeia archaeon]